MVNIGVGTALNWEKQVLLKLFVLEHMHCDIVWTSWTHSHKCLGVMEVVIEEVQHQSTTLYCFWAFLHF